MDKNESRYLTSMLDRANAFVQHLDTQINILLGVCLAIFLYSVGRFIEDRNAIYLLILGIFAGISALICLLAVHPHRFMRKRGQSESLMYNKKIIGFKSALEYSKKLEKTLEDREFLIKEYSTEIYNLYKHYYRPKRKLFNLARNILVDGIILGLLVFLVSLV